MFNVNQPSHSATYSYFKIWPWKSWSMPCVSVVKGLGHIWPWKLKNQGHCQGQTWWSHLRPKVQSMCLLFVSWQSDHFGLKYSKLHIWPWKIKVKVMAKVEPDGHIWGLKFNRYVCFSFRGNRTILGWDIANSMFDLENWSKVKVMAKVKPNSHIWGPVFNRYVYFLVCGNQTIFGWDIANSIFDLENSRSRSWRKSTKI